MWSMPCLIRAALISGVGGRPGAGHDLPGSLMPVSHSARLLALILAGCGLSACAMVGPQYVVCRTACQPQAIPAWWLAGSATSCCPDFRPIPPASALIRL